MGKQVKSWVPPADDEIIETVAQQPEPVQNTGGWTPPAEDEIIEPVKKKDSAAPVTPSPDGSVSVEPGQPSGQPTSKPTPTTSQSKKRPVSIITGPNTYAPIAEADIERRMQAPVRELTEAEKEFQKNKIRNPLVSAGKSIWNIAANQIPSAGAGVLGIMAEGANLAQMSDTWTPKGQKTQTIEDVKFQSQVAKARFLEYSQEQNLESAEYMKYVVNTLDNVRDPIDGLNYIFNAIGQALGQIPLSVATLGGSSIMQEVGSIYLQSVQNIATDRGLTIRQVIEQGLDEPGYALAYGTAAGLMDRAGAGKVMSAFTKGAVKKAMQNRALGMAAAGGWEGGTEVAQTILEQIGAQHGAGKSFTEAITAVVSNPETFTEWKEALVQGVIGGSALKGASDQLASVVKHEESKIDVNDPKSIDQATQNIENAANQTQAMNPSTEAVVDNAGTYDFSSSELQPKRGQSSSTPDADPAGPGVRSGTVTEVGTDAGSYDFSSDPIVEPQSPDATTGDTTQTTQSDGQNETEGQGRQEELLTDQEQVDDQPAPFRIGDKDTFYHASTIKRKGRLKPNVAANLGKGIYFATDKKRAEDEYGDNVTTVRLNISNPVEYGTRSPEWKRVRQLAIQNYNNDQKLKFKGDPEDFTEETDIDEVPSIYISDAALSLGHDAVFQQNDRYGHEINVLDESKILYEEDTPQQKANRELDALVESGDISREGNKVTILTEKGGRETRRIYDELEKAKSDVGGGRTTPTISQGTGTQSGPGDTGSPQQQQDEPVPVNAPGQQGSEDIGGNVPTDQASTPQGGIPTDTPPPTDSVALDHPDDQKLSGIKKALVPESKVEQTPVEKRSTEDMLLRAKEQVDSGQINPKAIVDEIAKGDARALQADEVASLVYYKTQLDNKVSELSQELIDAIDAGDASGQMQAQIQLDALNQEIDNYHEMSVKTAYEQSLAFRLRQMLLDNEYNLKSQILKYKATNKGEITPEVEARFKELDTQLKAANQRIQALEQQQAKATAESSASTIRAELQRQRERRIKAAQARKKDINDFFDKIKVKSDPNKLNSITQVVGDALFNGSVEAVRAAVLAGNDVATAIQIGIDHIRANYKGTGFNDDDYRSLMEPGLKRILPPSSTVQEDTYRSPTVTEDGELRIPESMIRRFAEEADNIEQLTDMLHSVVKEDFPDVSVREVRDAITKYGKTRELSKDELSVRLREMKRIGKLISSLEDIENQKRPLRSGLQRDRPTDEERRMMKQVKEAMKDLPMNDAEVDQAWRTALDQVKARLRNQISDLEDQIATGKKTPKKKGIEYDDEAKALREERDALKEVIQKIEGKPKMSDEQKIRMAIAGVERSVADLERRIATQDVSPAPRSTTPVTPELQALRDRRKALADTYRQMQDELGATERKRLEAQKKAVQKAINNYQRRINEGDFAPPKKRAPVKPDQQLVDLKLERDKIKNEFDVLQEKARYANREWNEKVWDGIMDVWNLPKSFLSSFDLSAPFRQGFFLAPSHPKEWVRSWPEMFRQAFSEKKATEWLLRLRETDAYAVMKNAGLYLAEPTTKHTAREEGFLSNLGGKIPVIGRVIKGSERGYTGFLNKLRSDVFISGMDALRSQGMTPETHLKEYKALAKFINNATGRGNLGALETAAPVLNGVFFAPKYWASRLNLINPVAYAKMPAPVRKMALKSLAAFIGTNVMFLMLADAAFDDDDLSIEWDPRSSDFGKVKIGDTRYDPWAGFQPNIRFIAQFITGERKSTTTGNITKIDGTKFPFETRKDLVERMFRSKASPVAGYIWNMMEGKDFVGKEVDPLQETLRLWVPLVAQDMKEIYDEGGATGMVQAFIPAFFGFGVQRYGAKSGINADIDPNDEVQVMNQRNNYFIKQTDRLDLQKSFEQDVSKDMHRKYEELRDKEIKRLFDRYKFRLEDITDRDIYDKSMDAIVKEADRKAKFAIAKESKWATDKYKEGNKFKLKRYVKKDGKVQEKRSLLR